MSDDAIKKRIQYENYEDQRIRQRINEILHAKVAVGQGIGSEDYMDYVGGNEPLLYADYKKKYLRLHPKAAASVVRAAYNAYNKSMPSRLTKLKALKKKPVKKVAVKKVAVKKVAAKKKPVKKVAAKKKPAKKRGITDYQLFVKKVKTPGVTMAEVNKVWKLRKLGMQRGKMSRLD
jgi:hypothetical protein